MATKYKSNDKNMNEINKILAKDKLSDKDRLRIEKLLKEINDIYNGLY